MLKSFTHRLPAGLVSGLLAGISLMAVPAVASESDDPGRGDLTLVWADEFNTDGPPDARWWTAERGFKRNEEAQWYQSDNARCQDGVLVIEARRERVPNPGYQSDNRDWVRRRKHAEYTSTSLQTRGRFAWQYGVMEVRARVDARPGLWPAIWTLGERGRWPENGEVDLMEYYAGDILANACWKPAGWAGPEWDAVRKPVDSLGGAEWAGEFHTWRMDWDPERIVLSVDELVLNTIDAAAVPTPDSGVHPFRQPHYILLNLAVGGTKGGDPSNTDFPGRFEVDFVRVYERPAAE